MQSGIGYHGSAGVKKCVLFREIVPCSQKRVPSISVQRVTLCSTCLQGYTCKMCVITLIIPFFHLHAKSCCNPKKPLPKRKGLGFEAFGLALGGSDVIGGISCLAPVFRAKLIAALPDRPSTPRASSLHDPKMTALLAWLEPVLH